MSEQTDDSAVVAKLCVEQWKLLQRFSKAIELVPDGDRNRLVSQVRYSELQLQSLAAEAGLKLITFDGELFGPGCPAKADNLEDFSDEEGLIVERTLEPAVVRNMHILQPGRVLLAIQNQ
ncbi:hypothetical protein [Rhizobium sp. WYCCWR 11146]|uniref:hypothetical protein n=1 Tax=Rhizobium sp. WYCCWR 11146 TaxID=2749833 RepID=UPI0015E6D785|nr:hypothetical protein [Rhizobium sp. WYCCWR 11146]MBA1349347.1 hypothetical protein [Rhizobium sp. WYCCWR 11146]